MSDEKVRLLHEMINASMFGWPTTEEVKKAHELLDEIAQWRREVPPRIGKYWVYVNDKWNSVDSSCVVFNGSGLGPLYDTPPPPTPPLGLMSKKLWEERRTVDLCEAIQRYVDAGRTIPMEWVDELLKRVKWLPNDSL